MVLLVDPKVVDGPCAEEAEAGYVAHLLVEDVGFNSDGAAIALEDVQDAYRVADGVAAAPNIVELHGA